jgi:hypothetical protein
MSVKHLVNNKSCIVNDRQYLISSCVTNNPSTICVHKKLNVCHLTVFNLDTIVDHWQWLLSALLMMP